MAPAAPASARNLFNKPPLYSARGLRGVGGEGHGTGFRPGVGGGSTTMVIETPASHGPRASREVGQDTPPAVPQLAARKGFGGD